MTTTAPPNFLILVPDQLRADALGAFGNAHAATPHIDALAARGTRFTNAFVQHPVCSPSRASILTGWYPHTAGHRTLTHLLREHEPNLLRILKDSGYHVTWAGMRGDTFAEGVTELSVDEYGFSTWPTVVHENDYPDDWARCSTGAGSRTMTTGSIRTRPRSAPPRLGSANHRRTNRGSCSCR